MAHKHLIPLCRTYIFLYPDVWAAEPSIYGSAGWVNSPLLANANHWGWVLSHACPPPEPSATGTRTLARPCAPTSSTVMLLEQGAMAAVLGLAVMGKTMCVWILTTLDAEERLILLLPTCTGLSPPCRSHGG